jgi:opacity protein-like surface antigen
MNKIIIGVVFSLFVVVTNVVAESPTVNSSNDNYSSLDSHVTDADPINFIEKTGEKEVDGRGHPYFGVITGSSIAKIGESQLDTTAGIDTGYTQYVHTNNYYGAFLYGINGGYEFKLGSNGLLSLGLGIYQTTDYHSRGQVWEVDAPSGTSTHQFDYEYKIHSNRFMAEAQFGWQFALKKIKLIPFVSFGIGPSLNFASYYSETAVYPDASASPGFNSHINTSFAYQLGAGIAYPLTNYNRLSIAYRYADSGKAHFSSREGYPAYQLDTGRIRANEVYIGYTHLFDF